MTLFEDEVTTETERDLKAWKSCKLLSFDSGSSEGIFPFISVESGLWTNPGPIPDFTVTAFCCLSSQGPSPEAVSVYVAPVMGWWAQARVWIQMSNLQKFAAWGIFREDICSNLSLFRWSHLWLTCFCFSYDI